MQSWGAESRGRCPESAAEGSPALPRPGLSCPPVCVCARTCVAVCTHIWVWVCIHAGALKPAESRWTPPPPPVALQYDSVKLGSLTNPPPSGSPKRPQAPTGLRDPHLLRCSWYSAHLIGGGCLWGVLCGEWPGPGRQAWGPSRVLTCLSSQAPALQQYRASAGSPANQSPTSPVSNQGFSPGSSPQVRDAASPLPAPRTTALLCVPHVSTPHRLCLTPHSIASRPRRQGREKKALPRQAQPRSCHVPTVSLWSLWSPIWRWWSPHSNQ